MKFKAVVIGCLTALIVCSFGYEYGTAASKGEASGIKIAVVSVQKVIQNSKRSAKYREEATAHRDRTMAELEKLRAEIEADKAGLNTLKAGSPDQIALVKTILTKQGSLQAQQKFYEQETTLKEQRMLEDIYKDMLQQVNAIAKEKGFDLVFEKSEPQFPVMNAEDLMRTIASNKLLYGGNCVDISDEVMSKLDGAAKPAAEDSNKPAGK